MVILNHRIDLSLDTVARIVKKLHIENIFFNMSKLFCSKVENIDSDIMHRLETISPDNGKSCIRITPPHYSIDNQLDSKNTYDLQVIIPVYNVEKYLERCVDSVLNQKTKFSFLVTIVNDDSTDNSREILNKYEQLPNVNVLDQPNGGVAVARNNAISHIHAKYITFVDADDYLLQDSIESLMNMAVKSGADIVQGGFNYIDETGFTYKKYELKEKLTDATLTGFPWGKVFKSKLFDNVWFPDGYWFEDTVMSVIYALSNNKASVADLVYAYRKNPHGLTSSSAKSLKTLDTIYCTNTIYNDRIELNIPFTQQDYEDYLSQVAMNYSRFVGLNNPKVLRLSLDAHVHMKNRFFSGFTAKSPRGKRIEYALNHKVYNLYRIACRL